MAPPQKARSSNPIPNLGLSMSNTCSRRSKPLISSTANLAKLVASDRKCSGGPESQRRDDDETFLGGKVATGGKDPTGGSSGVEGKGGAAPAAPGRAGDDDSDDDDDWPPKPRPPVEPKPADASVETAPAA
mmetsp:Transcript_32540/g.83646  ORF Transcript_32540/g.83646 Transcript_32540/m.83646 type:complete len:131 (+) Transcript_32540:1142-1534(+)